MMGRKDDGLGTGKRGSKGIFRYDSGFNWGIPIGEVQAGFN